MAIQAQIYSENNFSCSPQDYGCTGGGGGLSSDFYFNFQHKQRQQQDVLVENEGLPVSTSKNNESNPCAVAFSQSTAVQVENQRQEIDKYIRLQNERLRANLQEQRKQDVAILMKKIESRTILLLKQKDAEIAKGRNRAMEYEKLLRKLEAENEAWQSIAREKEAMVMSLNNTIQQLKENVACNCYNNTKEDAESCCDVNSGEEEENNVVMGLGGAAERGQGVAMEMDCKRCSSRESCVLLLPCRHLCSCKACEAYLVACPVCATVKKASIEVLIS